MQSFAASLYLYIVKTIRHLLFLVLLCCVTAANAAETYVIIISGGRSRLFNHERYWNDCAFLYRTLRHDYHIPQRNITLLISDGDNPSPDMLHTGATGFASSPTDLDGDGLPDLHLAATRQNLTAAMQQLAMDLTTDDNLFLYIVDHGELSETGSAYLWLWGNEQLMPGELAAMLAPLHPASTAILLGHCYAGAFVSSLQGEGRIVVASCAADELSWSCPDRPYDEFVYHWTCAIAQHDEQGSPVTSDMDGDGRITMAEAFDYARRHDQRPETPCIISQPQQLADKWSFGYVTNGITDIVANAKSSPTWDLQGRRKQSGWQGGIYIENRKKRIKNNL